MSPMTSSMTSSHSMTSNNQMLGTMTWVGTRRKVELTVTPLCHDGWMELAAVHELVGRVAGVDAGCADRVVLEAAAGQLRRLKSWVESREVAVARGLATVSSFPEKSLADASRSSVRHAEQVHRTMPIPWGQLDLPNR